jgi:WD40 repeat protein
MLSRSRHKIALLAAPVVLLGLLLLLSSRRPHPVPGLKGPAGIAGPAAAIAYGPDGTLVCISNNGTVQKYFPDQKRFRSFINADNNRLSSAYGNSQFHLNFSADGKRVIASTPGPLSGAVVFDVATRTSKYAIDAPTTGAFDVSRDEKWAAFSAANGSVLLDLNQQEPAPTRSSSFYTKNRRYYASRPVGTMLASCLRFSPDSQTLAMGYNTQIALFDINGDLKTPISQASITAANPYSLEWSPDGKKLAVLTSNEIAIFDSNLQKLASASLPNGTLGTMPTFGVAGGGMGATLVWTRDGKTLFSGGDEVQRWNASDLSLEASYGMSGPVALSPDNKTLVTSSKANSGQFPYLLQWRVG